MNFDELEKSLDSIDKYERYQELIDYIVDKRRNDQSYREVIKSKIVEIINAYCMRKEQKKDFVSSKEILESSTEYEFIARLKYLVNNEEFLNEIVNTYIERTKSKTKVINNISEKCKFDLLGVRYNSRLILENCGDKYVGNPEMLSRVWKYLNTEVFIDASSAPVIDEINHIQSLRTLLDLILRKNDEEFFSLGCELLRNFYELRQKELLNSGENNSINSEIEILRLNYKCIDELMKKRGISDYNASLVFALIKDKLLDESYYIHYLVNDDEYDLNNIEKNVYLLENIYVIKKKIRSVYEEKTMQILDLTREHNEYNQATQLTLVNNFVNFSQSIYVMYILQLIEKNPGIILNFDKNEKLEEYVVNRLINMDTLNSVYEEVLAKYLKMNFDYSMLVQIPEYCFTPKTGKDLLQYLMYVPGNNSINGLNYDKNQEILVDAIYKIIYYEIAQKYTEERIELGRRQYIKFLKNKLEKLDVYRNLSGFGFRQYKFYCGLRRKEIYDEIECVKSKDTSGFVSTILGEYIYNVYGNTEMMQKLGEEIERLKSTFMDLCKEILSDITFDNDQFVIDENGITIYNINVIKEALNAIVSNGGYGTSLDKIKQTVALQYKINYYTYASKQENIIYCIWNKIFSIFSSIMTEKINELKGEIESLKLPDLVSYMDKDEYDTLAIQLEELIEKEQRKKFISKKKISTYEKIQSNVQYIIAAKKLKEDYINKFSSPEYNKIIKDKNYNELSTLIEQMLKLEEVESDIENIVYCLSDSSECDFNIVDNRIKNLSVYIYTKIAELKQNILLSPRKASDLEIERFKDLCDKLGKSIDDTIELLSNEKNFVTLLALVAGYDDTLIEMENGSLDFEQVFSMNPESSENLKNNLISRVGYLLAETKQDSNNNSILQISSSLNDDDLGTQLNNRLKK